MDYYKDLSVTKTFGQINEFDCQAMMFCFKTRFKVFKKGESILKQGESIEDVVMIVRGSAIVENVDQMGNISVVMRLGAGEVYGLEATYVGDEVNKDSVIATEKTTVMFMNKYRLIYPCQNKCKRHDIVIRNLMQMVAERNVELMNKLTHMSKKSTRDKLLSYFTLMAKRANSNYFEIPFNKTELANYLSVDRSAMSTELAKMRDEGLIDFDKNEYRLNLDFLNKNK